MQNGEEGRFLFESLRLVDHDVFKGVHEFIFDPRRTIFAGPPGSGMGTIFNALASPLQPHGILGAGETSGRPMPVTIRATGSSLAGDLLRNIVFIAADSIAPQGNFSEIEIREYCSIRALADEVRSIFQTLLQHKPEKFRLYQDLNTESMAMGEKICFTYAVSFAIRKAMRLNLPFVAENPFDRLDCELMAGLRDYLEETGWQQILFLTISEKNRVFPDVAADYILPATE